MVGRRASSDQRPLPGEWSFRATHKSNSKTVHFLERTNKESLTGDLFTENFAISLSPGSPKAHEPEMGSLFQEQPSQLDPASLEDRSQPPHRTTWPVLTSRSRKAVHSSGLGTKETGFQLPAPSFTLGGVGASQKTTFPVLAFKRGDQWYLPKRAVVGIK